MLDITTRRPAPVTNNWKWSRTGRRVLLLTHILTSVGWWGGAVTVATFVVAASASGDPALATALYRAVGMAVWVTVAGGVTAGATGILLGLGTRWGVIRFRWVVVKEAITAVMIVTDLTVVRTEVAKVLAGTEAPAALLGPTMGHVVFLTVATVLSVFKPWGRMPKPLLPR